MKINVEYIKSEEVLQRIGNMFFTKKQMKDMQEV